MSLKVKFHEEWSSNNFAILCVAILLLGAAFRAAQYAADRSLWLDEAMLALNIVNRSFLELAQLPLEYDQAAPLGFLLSEKLLTTLFGNADYVLRILPLLSGLASLWALYALAKRVLAQRVAIVTAVLLFAVSAPLIYYASEVKQYSCDVLICLLLLAAIIRNFRPKPFPPRLSAAGGVGSRGIVVLLSRVVCSRERWICACRAFYCEARLAQRSETWIHRGNLVGKLCSNVFRFLARNVRQQVVVGILADNFHAAAAVAGFGGGSSTHCAVSWGFLWICRLKLLPPCWLLAASRSACGDGSLG
jgi:hypothetical protein